LGVSKIRATSSYKTLNIITCNRHQFRQAYLALAGLIDFPFKYRDRVDINTDANNLTGSGFYAVYCWGDDIASKHYPIELGHIIVFQDGAGGSVSQLAISDNGTYTRMSWGVDNWSEWIQLS
jgi:hypothetical protein